jgi:hypothetical protein
METRTEDRVSLPLVSGYGDGPTTDTAVDYFALASGTDRRRKSFEIVCYPRPKMRGAD